MNESLNVENQPNFQEVGAFREIYCDTIHMHSNGAEITISVAADKGVPSILIAKNNVALRIFIDDINKHTVKMGAGSKQDPKVMLAFDSITGNIKLVDETNENGRII